MFSVQQYTRADLPTWTPEERPLWTPYTLPDIRPDSDSDRAVRLINIGLGGYRPSDSLNELLKRGDHEFQKVAERCDATVIDHRWGLYKLGESAIATMLHPAVIRENQQFNIPPDYVLSAEVLVLNGLYPPSKRATRRIRRGTKRYERTSTDFYLSDILLRQFASTQCPERATEKTNLLDLDLFFQKI